MHPILIQIGGFTLRTYGVLIATAFLVAMLVASREAERKGIGSQEFADMVPFILLGAILGAWLWHVGMHLGEYLKVPSAIFAFWRGGLAIQGGILGSSLVGIWLVRKREISVARLADTIAPAAALGTAIGRWACLMNGDSYGAPTDLPWGITFTDPRSMIPDGLLGVKLHPTQLYTSLAMFLVFGFLWPLRTRLQREGVLFLLYLVLYSSIRFGIEFFRGDRSMLGMLSVAQWAAVVTSVVAIIFLIRPYIGVGHQVTGMGKDPELTI